MVDEILGGSFDSRCEMMLEVTIQTLKSDPELRLCEGLRLIEATRTAVSRLAPTALDRFDDEVLPKLRQMLMARFGVADMSGCSVN